VSLRHFPPLTSTQRFPKHTASLASPSKIQPPRPQGLLAKAGHVLLTSPRLLFDSLKILLPTAIFFIKFLEWWYSPGSPARALVSPPTGPVIPPPRILLPHSKGVPFDRTQYGQCPLCHEPFKNATALPSGYVFCYRCAFDHVSKYGQCPVTLLPTQIWQLRKILV
jgi:peroxin-12